MSSDPIQSKSADMKLEVHIVPVSDVERAKQFYQRLAWRLDDDFAPTKDLRIVQFTPPGSACSVTFGKGITLPRLARPLGRWSSPTSKRPMTNSWAVASRRVTSGTARRSRRRPGSGAQTLSARATGRSFPSAIPTAISG